MLVRRPAACRCQTNGVKRLKKVRKLEQPCRILHQHGQDFLGSARLASHGQRMGESEAGTGVGNGDDALFIGQINRLKGGGQKQAAESGVGQTIPDILSTRTVCSRNTIADDWQCRSPPPVGQRRLGQGQTSILPIQPSASGCGFRRRPTSLGSLRKSRQLASFSVRVQVRFTSSGRRLSTAALKAIRWVWCPWMSDRRRRS